MAIPPISLVAMIFSAASLIVALAMAFLVLWQAPREPDNQLMSAYMLTVVFWGSSAFLMRFVALGGQNPTIFFYGVALGIGFAGLLLFAVVSHYADLWRRWWVLALMISGLVYYLLMIPQLFAGNLYTGITLSAQGRLDYSFKPPGYVTFGVSYLYYIATLITLWRNRKSRAGNLLPGGVIISLGVLTSIIPALAQYSLAISSAAIASILFAGAILREHLFNPMARLNEELANANQQLRQLTEDLRLANVQITEVSRLKSHFLANMSHELRTPLNSIIGYTEMLIEGVYGELNDKQRDRMDRVMRNGQHLLQLINDILDLSKIEAGRMELDIEAVDLAAVIEECLATFEPMAQKKGVQVARHLTASLPPILADRGRAAQVLMNLVSNAVKFTQAGTVTVRAEPVTLSQAAALPVSVDGAAGPWLLLTVQDTGIGIEPENQALIFDEFRQADSSPSREYEGTGLGLAITRRLVEMMNGQIWLSSTPGEGSTFFVLLPLVTQPAPPGSP